MAESIKDSVGLHQQYIKPVQYTADKGLCGQHVLQSVLPDSATGLLSVEQHCNEPLQHLTKVLLYSDQ